MVEAPSTRTEMSRDTRRTRRRGRDLRVRRVIAFAVGYGFVLVIAFRGGGYDIVARQELALVIWALIALGFAFGMLPAAGRPRSLRRPCWRSGRSRHSRLSA